ncbi:MAG: Uma2 family endonuclease [Chthonomonadaceae bacterium]|nr:Uma2 family endonuclease [Chthonomonadaceae bacterium]
MTPSTTISISPPKLLTYKAYLEEGEINRRYDIIDGERKEMANPTEDHQDITFRLATLLHAYGKRTGLGKMTISPQDVLIRRNPLRTRQPDVLFISTERRARNRPSNDPAPMSPAPELVIEVVSTSETEQILNAKIADYCLVEVEEVWIVRPALQTVEVQRLTSGGAVSVATYGSGETVKSLAFPELAVFVNAIFAA